MIAWQIWRQNKLVTQVVHGLKQSKDKEVCNGVNLRACPKNVKGWKTKFEMSRRILRPSIWLSHVTVKKET